MKHYVSIRRNGTLTNMPTAWVFLGILVPAAAFLSALRLQAWAPATELPGIMAGAATLMWVGTAAICLFTAVMNLAARGDAARTRFLLAAGLVTLWLGLNGVVALHGEVLPALGMPEMSAAVYAVLGAFYLIASWHKMLTNRPVLLVAASLFFVASLNAERIAPAADLAEPGLTFLAVAFWAGFHVVAAARTVEELATGRITAVTLSSARLLRRAA